MQSKLRWLSILPFVLLSVSPKSAYGQDWFRTAIGMDVNKPRVAVADFTPRADSAKTHSGQFTQVVRDDLQFSGILELVSPSFYPPDKPTNPGDLRSQPWIDPPLTANMVALGNLVPLPMRRFANLPTCLRMKLS